MDAPLLADRMDLKGWKVETWYALKIAADGINYRAHDYYRSKEQALAEGKGRGFRGADGFAEAVTVLTKNGKAGYLVGPAVTLNVKP